jgi:L-rhamnose mutarotase
MGENLKNYSVCLTEQRDLWYYLEAEDEKSAVDMSKAMYADSYDELVEDIAHSTLISAHAYGIEQY